jgi:heme/copper-type cytochrome/quinol oxidase subunit 1
MEQAQGSDLVRVYRRLYTYVRPYRFIIFPAVLATTAYALVTGTVPFFMEDIFEQLRVSATDALTDEQSNRSAPWRLPL